MHFFKVELSPVVESESEDRENGEGTTYCCGRAILRPRSRTVNAFSPPLFLSPGLLYSLAARVVTKRTAAAGSPRARAKKVG